MRGLAFREGEFMRFISLHPDHDVLQLVGQASPMLKGMKPAVAEVPGRNGNRSEAEAE
jgi:hypothetical protein